MSSSDGINLLSYTATKNAQFYKTHNHNYNQTDVKNTTLSNGSSPFIDFHRLFDLFPHFSACPRLTLDRPHPLSSSAYSHRLPPQLSSPSLPLSGHSRNFLHGFLRSLQPPDQPKAAPFFATFDAGGLGFFHDCELKSSLMLCNSPLTTSFGESLLDFFDDSEEAIDSASIQRNFCISFL